jgi:membrane protease YdiL (CAAX protease family)
MTGEVPATPTPMPPGGWRRWFYGERGLRAGWCFLRFTFLYLLLSGGGNWLGVQLDPPAAQATGWEPGSFIWSEGISLLAALLCLLLAARLERRPLAAYGVPPRAVFGARFWEGTLWGAAAVSALMAAIWLLGGYSAGGLALSGGALARYALIWAVAFLLGGIGEEVIFRGYTLFTLARGIGFWPAAWLLSALFGALHYLTKPMETWADLASTGLLGLFTCYTVFRTGDVWLAAGFHSAWNFLALGVYGGPNTGNEGRPLHGHLLASSFHGPQWLTGGPMGPEASLLIFPLLALLGAACFWRFRRAAPGLQPWLTR